eukprot:scaffold10402_cov96-Isochrysis_galbana.AAC.4
MVAYKGAQPKPCGGAEESSADASVDRTVADVNDVHMISVRIRKARVQKARVTDAGVLPHRLCRREENCRTVRGQVLPHRLCRREENCRTVRAHHACAEQHATHWAPLPWQAGAVTAAIRKERAGSPGLQLERLSAAARAEGLGDLGVRAGMDEDLYNTLGVDKEATDDEVKRAFRRLSLAYHPDRWQDQQDKREAGQRFLRVARAYTVLSDSSKRMAYDELGPHDFEQGVRLLSTEVNSAAKLRAKFDREQRRSAEREYQSRLQMAGSVVVSATASDMLAPADPDTPWSDRMGPSLASVAMSEDMTLMLGQRSALTLGCQILTRAGLGGCTLRMGFKRQLGHHSAIQASASGFNGAPGLGLTASRRISRHSTASISGQVSSRGLTGFALRASRQLSRHTLAELVWTLGTWDEPGSLALRLNRSAGRQGEEGGGGAEESPHEHNEADREAQRREREGREAEGREAEASEAEGRGLEGGAAAAEAAAGDAAAAEAAAGARAGGLLARTRCAVHHDASILLVLRRSLLRRLPSPASAAVALRSLLHQLVRRLRSRMSRSGCEISLQPTGPRMGATLVWRHSRRSRSKLAVRFLLRYRIAIVSTGVHVEAEVRADGAATARAHLPGPVAHPPPPRCHRRGPCPTRNGHAPPD